MRVVGVIAEYNPFHTGHAHHLREARRLSGADAVVVVLSSVFTQRGDACILPPADRVRMALSSGVDAVFALPTLWSVRSAEDYARAGIGLLNGLGCDAVSFGAETPDFAILQQIAGFLEEETEAFRGNLRDELAKGKSYPAAAAQAAAGLLPEAETVLAQPNNLLAVSYLRALLRLNSPMEAFPVRRESGYHDHELQAAYPSAGALRQVILREGASAVSGHVPETALPYLLRAEQEGRIHRPGALDLLLREKLLDGSLDWAALPDTAEGCEHLLQKAARQYASREEILQHAKTRRYTYARLSRICTFALLGMTRSMTADIAEPPCAWLLGFRKESEDLLSELSKKSSLPILGKAADYPEKNAPWFQLECRAYDLWSLGTGMPVGMALKQGVAVV